MIEGLQLKTLDTVDISEAHFSEQTANSTKDLKIVLHNRISLSRAAYERSLHFIGSLINWLCMEKESGAIEINGIEMLALAKILNEEIEIKIHPRSHYLLDFDQAERLFDRLNNL